MSAVMFDTPESARSVKVFCPGSAFSHVEPVALDAIRFVVDPLRIRFTAFSSVLVLMINRSPLCSDVVTLKNVSVFT